MEFRPFCRADIPHVLTWFRTPAELFQWGGPKRRFPLDEAQMAALLSETGGAQPDRRMWAGLQQGALVAMASAVLDWDQGTALLTMVGVAPSARGQGLAAPFLRDVLRAVFQEPEFERLELNVYTFNTAAILTYDALGFVREGVRRSMARVGDERWDAAHYAMLRGDYSLGSQISIVPREGRGRNAAKSRIAQGSPVSVIRAAIWRAMGSSSG